MIMKTYLGKNRLRRAVHARRVPAMLAAGSVLLTALTASLTGARAAATTTAVTGAAAHAATAARVHRHDTDCAPHPGACGFPDARNTGVKHGTQLRVIRHSITLDRDGATLKNAVVHGVITIAADHVTVRNVRVVVNGETWAIGLVHTRAATIVHVEIAPAPDARRLLVGIKDVYGDAHGTRILKSDVAGASTGVQTHEGLVRDNYVHALRMRPGDHVNGFTSNGSTEPLRIEHNTILNRFDQTDAIGLFQDFGLEANRTIKDNLLAGGDYPLYAGSGDAGHTHNIVVVGNHFSRIYADRGGTYGPVAYYDGDGAHNRWSGNIWDESGAPVGAP